MPRQYQRLVPALTFCTMLAIAGTARAAETITPDAPPTAAEIAAARRALPGGYSPHAIMLVYFVGTMTVLESMHHGMHDLRFDNSTYVFRWTGTAYRGSAE